MCSLRRRFAQNQEDCNITVLALLPTATEGIIEALPVESLTHELQQKKAERLGRSAGGSRGTLAGTSTGSPSEGTSVAEEEGQSPTGDSYVHASQMESSSAGASGEEKRPQKSKAQLWNEVKISCKDRPASPFCYHPSSPSRADGVTAITRTLTLIYTLSLLNLLTRIQLNLLGRRTYISSLIAASHAPPSPTISLENNDDDLDMGEKAYATTAAPDFDTNWRYLTFSWWLLHKGWRQILREVEAAVVECFGTVNPREDVSVEKMSHLILEVRRRIEGKTAEERRNRKWLHYMLPPEGEEVALLEESGMAGPYPPAPRPSPPTATEANRTDLPSPSFPPTSAPTSTHTISPVLHHLLLTTRDLIDSPPFHKTLTVSLDATFSHLTDNILRNQAYKLPPLSPPHRSNPTSQHIPQVPADATASASTKLANLLAVITRQAHTIGNGGDANEYMRVLGSVGDIDSFAGVIYAGMQDPTSAASLAAAHAAADEEKRTHAAGGEEGGPVSSMSEGVLDEVTRQTHNLVGSAESMVGSAVGMVSGVWSRFVGERGPGLG